MEFTIFNRTGLNLLKTKLYSVYFLKTIRKSYTPMLMRYLKINTRKKKMSGYNSSKSSVKLPPFFVLSLSILFCFSASGQNYTALKDSLQVVFEQSPDTSTINGFNDFAFNNIRDDEVAEVYAEVALTKAKEINYNKGQGEALVCKGIIAKNREQYQEAEQFYFQALEIRKALKDTNGVVNLYNNLGILIKRQGNYRKALQQFELAFNLLNPRVKKEDQVKIYNGLAISNMHLGNYQKALDYNAIDIEFRKTLNDNYQLANSLATAGDIYRKIRNYSLAEKNYKKSLSLYQQLDSKYLYRVAYQWINLGGLYQDMDQAKNALANYRNALELKDELYDDELALLYNNMAISFETIQQADSAMTYYRYARSIYTENDNQVGLAHLEFSNGLFFENNNQPRPAIEHYEKSLQIIQEHQIEDVQLQSNLFESLSDTYSMINEYESAFKFQQQHDQLQDSLVSLALEAANYKTNYEKQVYETQQLENEREIQTLKIMNLYSVLISVIVGLSMIIGFTILFFRQRQQKFQMEREIDDLLVEQEIATNYARIEGQDDERQRIAQDLHDRLGSMLSTIKLYFSTIDSKVDLLRLESREQYSKANQLLDEACDEVRKVAHDIHSGVLKNFGLKAQLQELVDTINNTKQIKIELLTHKINDRLETKVEINIYRIVQELISNALKHSKASKLSIQLNRFGDIIHILVEDNGVGFKESNAREKNGMGLSGIETRVNAMNGTINIDSVLGRGTSIAIDLPYQPQTALSENL